MSAVNVHPLRSGVSNSYIIPFSFTTVSSGSVAVYSPSWGSDLAIARTGNGAYTLTFAGSKKPYSVVAAVSSADKDNPLIFAHEYSQSTGVLTIQIYDADTPAADNTAGYPINVLMFCTQSSRSR